MVEAVGADLLKDALEKFGSKAWKKVIFAKDLKTHLHELQELKSAIKAALHGVDPFEAGSDFQGYKINFLRRALDVLEIFFDEQAAKTKLKEVMGMGGSKIKAEVRLFFSSSNHLISPFRDAEKVNSIKAELGRIARVNALVSPITIKLYRNPNQGCIGYDTGPLLDTDMVVGRDEDRDSIITRLFHASNDIESSVVAIVGVGGLGKTTLAQYVYQDERVKNCFDARFWIYVTPDISVKDFLVKFIAILTGVYPENCEMAQLHHQLSRAMQTIVGKKCLLVLDNLWYRDNFREVWLQLRNLLKVGCLGAIDFKILATTRSDAVADVMGINDPYMLSELTRNDNWLLLRHFALKRGQELEPGIEALGKGIAEVCPKVPLVIKGIGCQLAQKHTIGDWQAFKVKLASNSAFLMEDRVVQTLKLSYDDLENNLKLCAAYWSLFPKGVVCYGIEHIVRIWIALGFVELKNNMILEDVGEEYMQNLLRHGIFEQGYFDSSFVHLRHNSFIQMHDVMHDLMLLIGKSKHQMISSKTIEIAEGICHVSLNEVNPNWGVLFSEFNGKQLQSILMVDASNDDQHYVDRVRLGSSRIRKIVSRFPNLKVLDLHDQDIEKVPECISELIHLRYLDLSRNPFSKLPDSITKLVHLQSLILVGCWNLRKLPRNICKLVKLRHLLLREDEFKKPTLTHMPKGIGKLTNLQELDLFVVCDEDGNSTSGTKGDGVAAKLAELGCLNNLRGSLTISVTGQTKNFESEFLTAQLEKKTRLSSLTVEFLNPDDEQISYHSITVDMEFLLQSMWNDGESEEVIKLDDI